MGPARPPRSARRSGGPHVFGADRSGRAGPMCLGRTEAVGRAPCVRGGLWGRSPREGLRLLYSTSSA
eukprot:14136570-Alexandrium_andersonii.AAC.1